MVPDFTFFWIVCLEVFPPQNTLCDVTILVCVLCGLVVFIFSFFPGVVDMRGVEVFSSPDFPSDPFILD